MPKHRSCLLWLQINGRFYTRGHIMLLDKLGQTFVIRLQCKDGHKTHYPSRRTIFCCATNERRITEDSSSGRIMRLVPVFTLETNNIIRRITNANECLPKFVLTDNASSSIKTANDSLFSFYLHSIPTDMKCKLINKRHHLHEVMQKHTNKRKDGL